MIPAPCAGRCLACMSVQKGPIMRLIVDPDACTGCGECEEICPEVFEVADELAEVIEDPVAPGHEEAALEALEACPMDAISEEEE